MVVKIEATFDDVESAQAFLNGNKNADSADNQELEDKISDLQEEVTELQEEVAKLKKDNGELTTKNTNQAGIIKNLQDNNLKLKTSNDELVAEKSRLNSQIEKLQSDNEALQDTLEATKTEEKPDIDKITREAKLLGRKQAISYIDAKYNMTQDTKWEARKELIMSDKLDEELEKIQIKGK